MKKTLGEHWIWVNRPTFPFVLNADLPDADGVNPSLSPDGPSIGTRPPGKMPAKFGLEFQWMPITLDSYGQNWDIRISFATIIPSLSK